MMIFDPSTGRFVEQADPAQMVADIEHEITMRELGNDPHLYPGFTAKALATLLRFWHTMRDAADAEHNAQMAFDAELGNLLGGYEGMGE